MCLLVIYKVFCAQGYAQLPRSPVTFMPQWGRSIHPCCFSGLSCSCQKTCFFHVQYKHCICSSLKKSFFYYFKFLLSVRVRVRVAELRCCEWVSEWVMLPLILSQGSHPLYVCASSCCVAIATLHTIKGQATFLLEAIRSVCLLPSRHTKTNKQRHTCTPSST